MIFGQDCGTLESIQLLGELVELEAQEDDEIYMEQDDLDETFAESSN